jgi:hypothetical protein
MKKTPMIAIELAPAGEQIVQVPVGGKIVSAGAPAHMVPHLFVDPGEGSDGGPLRDVVVLLDLQEESVRRGIPILAEFSLDALNLRVYIVEKEEENNA